MKACLLKSPAPIETNPLVFTDVPAPQPASGEVLVRVSYCGVCRTDLHIVRLQERVHWCNATATETLNMFTQRMQGMGDATLMAMKQLSQIVHRQAVVMGYGDAFFIVTVFYFGLSLLVMLLKKPPATGAGAGGQGH